MKKINIGIDSSSLDKVASMLFKLLADENVEYMKLKNYHWNVTGENFVYLHKFLDDLAESTYANIDDLAERIRSLGVKVNASMKEYLKVTSIKEVEGVDLDWKTMLSDILEDYESSINNLRKGVELCDEVGDIGTADFLTGIMEEKEKKAWMIRSSLE